MYLNPLMMPAQTTPTSPVLLVSLILLGFLSGCLQPDTNGMVLQEGAETDDIFAEALLNDTLDFISRNSFYNDYTAENKWRIYLSETPYESYGSPRTFVLFVDKADVVLQQPMKLRPNTFEDIQKGLNNQFELRKSINDVEVYAANSKDQVVGEIIITDTTNGRLTGSFEVSFPRVSTNQNDMNPNNPNYWVHITQGIFTRLPQQ